MHDPKDDAQDERLYSAHEIISCDSLPARDQRTVIFHLLYMLDSFDYSISVQAAVDQFCSGFLCTINPQGGIMQRVTAVVEQRAELDTEIKPLLHNWKFERLSVSTRLILRLAAWELKYTTFDVPIIINEALELAKSFAEVDAYKFINGILDEWVRQHRPEEAAALLVVRADAEGQKEAISSAEEAVRR